MSNATKWTKRTQQLTDPNPPSSLEILAGERMNAFDRNSAKRKIAPVSDDAAEGKNRFERKKVVRQGQTEGQRNPWGDPVNSTERKNTGTDTRRFARDDWQGSARQTRPVDEKTRELFDAMRADETVADAAAYRKPGEAKTQKPLAPKDNSFEDLQAMCLYIAAAFPAYPFDVRPDADENLKRIAKQNSSNLANMWRWLVFKRAVRNDLAGLISAAHRCVEENAFDDGQPRTRGFNQKPLVNIIPPPPDAPENSFVNEALNLVRSGRARFERQRPATEEETQNIIALRQKPFRELAAEAGSKRFSRQ